uniref:Uncharacterized protein n=1 Tax=Acrobeloides nanus TaxID=290746 RepID=A0A914EE05_9BILA
GSSYEWRLIFVIAAGINILAGIFFIFFGSAETQKWNEYKQKNSNKISGGEIASEGT